MIEYRWIHGVTATKDEWDKIDQILEFNHWPSLNRETALLLVAEDGDQIVGFMALNWIPHAEPLWVAQSHRGTKLAHDLADKMIQFLLENRARTWMAIADNPHAARLCKEHGMRKVESPVYVMP